MAIAIDIHEDDWGLRCIYPIAAYDHLRRDLEASMRAGEENRAEGGFGWTDIYLIEEPTENYLGSRLALSDIEPAFVEIMPRVAEFSSTAFSYIGSGRRDPYGSYVSDPWCFGLDADCYVYFTDEAGYLKSISYEFDGYAERGPYIRKAFAAIEALVPSVLVDYRLDACGPLNDGAFLDRYFAAQAEEFRTIDDPRKRPS